MVVKESVPLCAHPFRGICSLIIYCEYDDPVQVLHRVCQVGESLFTEMFFRNDSFFRFCETFSLPVHHHRYNNPRGSKWETWIQASCAKFHTLALEAIGGKPWIG